MTIPSFLLISAKFTAHTNSFSAGISYKNIQNDDKSKMTSIVSNLKVELNSFFTFFPLGPVWLLPLLLHEILLIHRSSLWFDMIALDFKILQPNLGKLSKTF